MVDEIPIPVASMQRLRQAYAQFEQLAEVIAEAAGVDTSRPHRLDLERGVFAVTEPSPNGVEPQPVT